MPRKRNCINQASDSDDETSLADLLRKKRGTGKILQLGESGEREQLEHAPQGNQVG